MNEKTKKVLQEQARFLAFCIQKAREAKSQNNWENECFYDACIVAMKLNNGNIKNWQASAHVARRINDELLDNSRALYQSAVTEKCLTLQYFYAGIIAARNFSANQISKLCQA